MLTVFVVSDGTGETAERVVQAALTQFGNAPVELVRYGDVRTPAQVRAVVQEAADGESIVLHTLVSDDIRRIMLAECRIRHVDSLDLMGPLLDRLALHLKLTPQEKPGLFQQLTEAKSREIEAVAYAFRHDDGQNAEELARAEVVLVGVSRTMKTPTMLYLAYRGWFAANVPLVPGHTLPRALTALPSERVFYLSMTSAHLLELRRIRATLEAIPPEKYASLEHIRREMEYAERMWLKHGWQRIEVTGKSVEEVAREIIAILSEEAEQEGEEDA
jgi:[pyruvate, water dikinase]-phosphate phosphotransferase / [pyruvate, water dikinase] kinase